MKSFHIWLSNKFHRVYLNETLLSSKGKQFWILQNEKFSFGLRISLKQQVKPLNHPFKMKQEKFKTIVYFRQVYLPCLTLFSKCRTYVLMTQPDSHRSTRFYKGLENEKRGGKHLDRVRTFHCFGPPNCPAERENLAAAVMTRNGSLSW